MTEQNPQPSPAPAPRTSSTSSSDEDARYCAYDPTYLRYVGTHHPTAAKAKAAAKADGRDVDALEYRKL